MLISGFSTFSYRSRHGWAVRVPTCQVRGGGGKGGQLVTAFHESQACAHLGKLVVGGWQWQLS